MKAIFPLESLRTTCAAIAPVVPSRTTKDILKNIKIAVHGEVCTISATDSEMSVIAFIRGVECQRDGEILLPCERLLKILREVSGETIAIDDVNGVAHISVGRSKFKIPTEDATKLVIEVDFPETGFRSISTADMQRITKRCSIVAMGDKNSAFSGIHFEFKDDKFNAISCDSKCLSLVDAAFTVEGDVEKFKTQTMVPPKAIKVFSSMLPTEGSVDFAITENAITFRGGDFIVKSQLIGGRFPDWRRVFPSSCSDNIEIPAPQLSNAIRQAMITTAEESCGVEFVFSDGSMTLTSKASGKGSSNVETPIGFSGKQEFLMDPQFILNGLALIDRNASITIGLNGPESAVLITSSDGLRYVAQPFHRE